MKPRTRNARTEFSPFLDVVVMKWEFEGWCFIDRSLWQPPTSPSNSGSAGSEPNYEAITLEKPWLPTHL